MHPEIALQLIQAGANINKVSDDGATPLIYAARRGHYELAKALLDLGAEIDKATTASLGITATPKGTTALTMAAAHGHRAIFGLLIERNAQVDAPSNEAQSPLLVASGLGYTDMVRVLLEKMLGCMQCQMGEHP